MPFRAFKIEWKNILIFFWRIFRILYRAVRASPKPLSMFLGIGVVHSALKGNINRHFEPVPFGFGDEMPEIFQRSQLWMDRFVTAFFGTDGPGAADIVRLRGDRIVFSFSERAADRMDRRKIDDIESHGRNIRKSGF